MARERDVLIRRLKEREQHLYRGGIGARDDLPSSGSTVDAVPEPARSRYSAAACHALGVRVIEPLMGVDDEAEA
jgi:hypothetical protein